MHQVTNAASSGKLQPPPQLSGMSPTQTMYWDFQLYELLAKEVEVISRSVQISYGNGIGLIGDASNQ